MAPSFSSPNHLCAAPTCRSEQNHQLDRVARMYIYRKHTDLITVVAATAAAAAAVTAAVVVASEAVVTACLASELACKSRTGVSLPPKTAASRNSPLPY